ncbi:MAG: GNAT family N-acetyltransferase [Bacteroidia bacterium]|jgi:hypothetical protein|nr:GNAT family N-acetyltransferase [Bacteroidia bacterium]
MITEICHTNVEQLAEVMEVYAAARAFMQLHGNPTQWGDRYPSEAFIREEIASGHSFVCLNEQGEIAGTFCFILGEDPTYHQIFEGSWLNDEPYGTLHRIASRGTEKGIAEACFKWSFSQCPNIRVDTHRDNRVMRQIIASQGFTYCGIIYVSDGTPRLAYQKKLTESCSTNQKPLVP